MVPILIFSLYYLRVTTFSVGMYLIHAKCAFQYMELGYTQIGKEDTGNIEVCYFPLFFLLRFV